MLQRKFYKLSYYYHLVLRYSLKSLAADLYRYKIYHWYKSSVLQHEIKWKKGIKKVKFAEIFIKEDHLKPNLYSWNFMKKHSSADIYHRFWFFNHRQSWCWILNINRVKRNIYFQCNQFKYLMCYLIWPLKSN